MKSQLLLPAVMYKNYNFSKSVQRKKKSNKEKSNDIKPIDKEHGQ